MRVVLIYGPPASGKLTVARQLSKITGYKIFHNHLTFDMVKSVLDKEHKKFWNYVNKFRYDMIKILSKEKINLILTLVYDADHPNNIKNIEKIVKIKFNKPYFTRENTLNRQKLLGNLYDVIIEKIVKKYPLLKIDKNKKKVFDSQLVFIDDIPNNLKDYPDKQIICPEYTYMPYYNIKEKLIYKYNINPEIFNNTEILNMFEKIPIYNENGSVYQKDIEFMHIHEILQIRLAQLYSNNSLNDTFFKDLITVLDKNKTIRKFDDIPE